jgi:hypothetical protein
VRLWSVHPRYLDRRGLVALWREGLLAQAVLRGRTRGYTRHPQLARFQCQGAPLACIAAYLRAVQAEASARGYRFATSKISRAGGTLKAIQVTRGQLEYEWRHLHAKLSRRDPEWLAKLGALSLPKPHPSFRVVAGEVEEWERVIPRRSAAG